MGKQISSLWVGLTGDVSGFAASMKSVIPTVTGLTTSLAGAGGKHRRGWHHCRRDGTGQSHLRGVHL